jgi:hypothetical protein
VSEKNQKENNWARSKGGEASEKKMVSSHTIKIVNKGRLFLSKLKCPKVQRFWQHSTGRAVEAKRFQISVDQLKA